MNASFIAQVDPALEAKANSLITKFAEVPSVSAVKAKLAWEKEAGLFVDVRATAPMLVQGFERIPLKELGKSLEKLIEAAKESGTKDIYFLDSSGFQAAQAAQLVRESPKMEGYNAFAIKGGILDWIDDAGPFSLANAEAQALRKKLRAEVETDKPNTSFIYQLAGEMGVNVPQHNFLSVSEEANEAVEHPLSIPSLIDINAFNTYVKKLQL